MAKHLVIIEHDGDPLDSEGEQGFKVTCLASGNFFFLNESDQFRDCSKGVPAGTSIDFMAEHYMDGGDGVNRCNGDHYVEGAVIDND